MSRRQLLVRTGLAFGSYVGLIVLATWPLAAYVTTHLPQPYRWNSSDTYYAGWALAWQTHALSTAPTSLPHAPIYAPSPLALFYSTPGFALLPCFAPVFLATGNPTLALNCTLLANLAMTATMVHLVTVRWTQSEPAGIAAGVAFLGSRWTIMEAGFMPQYTALAAIPLVIALVGGRTLDGYRVALLAALLAFEGLADAAYVGPPLFLTLSLACGGMLLVADRRSHVRRIVVAMILAAMALAPVYAGYFAVRALNPDLRRQTIWGGRLFEAQAWIPSSGPLALDRIYLVAALGFLVALVARDRGPRDDRPAWRLAGLWFLVGWAISWILPKQIVPFRAFVSEWVARDPLRLGFGGLIGACLLVGLGFASCAAAASRFGGRVGQRTTSWALLAAFVVARIHEMPRAPGTYPILPAPVAGAETATVRAGHGPVLVLPVNVVAPQEAAADAMYRGIAHWRPLVNGYSGYYPAAYPERMRLAAALPDDAEALEALRDATGLTTIVVEARAHPGIFLMPWLRALESGRLPGVSLRFQNREVIVLEVGPPPVT